ncbi:universal stress protein [Bifidobacterium aquikefiricola]|uniref:Universal stress protein n=1 Tax=Bifidobacterium aquikefiricola TaxID=3059038 RepID=A0AB39U4M2_9BIFI
MAEERVTDQQGEAPKDAAPQYEASTNDVVVGLDGSRESFAALRWSLAEASASGQNVNAVFGWTPSWNAGSEPKTDKEWDELRQTLISTLNDWVDDAIPDFDMDPERLTLTSVQASGPAALLEIGSHAQQIVVGKRNIGPLTRWFLGSTSAPLIEDAKVPVTLVHIPPEDSASVSASIAAALTGAGAMSGATSPSRIKPLVEPTDAAEDSAEDAANDAGTQSDKQSTREETQLQNRSPLVVGVDGSQISLRALEFAVHEADVHGFDLHVLLCWQMKDLGTIPGYENAVAPIHVGQARAEEKLRDIVARVHIPSSVTVHLHAFHTTAVKGIMDAAKYAGWIIVGSRGLTGMNARLLGSVSRQLVNLAECTVTIVH